MERELEKRLRECFADSEWKTHTAAYRQTVFLAKKEAQSRAERRRTGFGSFLVWYMKHKGVRIWLMQAVMLLCLGVLLLGIYDIPYMCTQRRISMLLCGLAVFLFMTAIPVVYRSVRYKMLEIEAAARFSTVRLILAEILTNMIGDVVMIGTIIGITVFKVSYSTSSAVLYLVIPFLVMCCIGIVFLRHVDMEKIPAYCSIQCVCAVMGIVLSGRVYPSCYEQAFSAVGAGICVGLLLLCGYQLRALMEHSAEALFR